MAESLFDEFQAATLADWRAAAEKELKGKPFDETLRSTTAEGLVLEPLYDREALEGLSHLGGLPGQAPYARGRAAARAAERPWAVEESVTRGGPSEAAEAVARHRAAGGTAIRLLLDAPGRAGLDADADGASAVGVDGLSLSTADELRGALGDADGVVSLAAGGAGGAAAALLAAAAPAGLSLRLGIDPLGAALGSGSLPLGLERALDDLAGWARWCIAREGDHVAARVDGVAVRDAGGHAVDELAIALAAATEYLRALIDRGLSADEAASQIEMELASGPRLFLEIAKLRAARLLWSKVCAAFGVSPDAAALRLVVRSSRHHRTRFDPWVNMIRGTVEGFVGAAVGADRVSIAPFDAEVGPSINGFGERMARNTQHLLREEGHLGRVQDPAGGSYVVERLTEELARGAWARFQEIEGAGGLAKALRAGEPQERVAASAAAAESALAGRSAARIGVTHYPNLSDERRPKTAATDPAALAGARAKALAEHRAGVDASARRAALEALGAAGVDEVAVRAIAAAAAGATLGEIAAARAAGEAFTVTALPSGPATRRLEGLRARAEAGDERPAALVLSVGADKPGRRAGFLRDVLSSAGLKVQLAGAEALASVPALVVLAAESDEAAGELAELAAKARSAGAVRVAAAGPGSDAADVTLSASADLYDRIEQLFDDLGIGS